MKILEARRRMLGAGVYKKTVTGNPAIAQGSLARMYPGITMQGWTEQDSTTGAQLWDEANETSYANGRRYVFQCEPNTDYTFSTDVTVSSLGVLYGEFNNENVLAVKYNTTELTFDSGEYDTLYMQVYNPGNFGDIKVMLNSGSAALPYEPYTGNKPSPSPEYPQKIVSAGTQNQETGKWEYEITIANAQTDATKNQTVLLASDRPLTKWDRLEKRNGQYGWVYKSEKIESYTDESIPGEYFSTTGQLSVGAQVWYETTEETFVPLTTAEQEAMNALHTYRPTTVLSNQQGCQMALTYKTRKSMEVTT